MGDLFEFGLEGCGDIQHGTGSFEVGIWPKRLTGAEIV
jgi:hypothetical protein